jgi:hypothetical protein
MMLIGTIERPPRTKHEYWIGTAGGGELLPTADMLRSIGWAYGRDNDLLSKHWAAFCEGGRTFWGGQYVLMVKKTTGSFQLMAAFQDFDSAVLAARTKMRGKVRYPMNSGWTINLAVDLANKGIASRESTIATVVGDLLERTDKVRKRGNIQQINDAETELAEAIDSIKLLEVRKKQLQDKRARMFNI